MLSPIPSAGFCAAPCPQRRYSLPRRAIVSGNPLPESEMLSCQRCDNKIRRPSHILAPCLLFMLPSFPPFPLFPPLIPALLCAISLLTPGCGFDPSRASDTGENGLSPARLEAQPLRRLSRRRRCAPRQRRGHSRVRNPPAQRRCA